MKTFRIRFIFIFFVATFLFLAICLFAFDILVIRKKAFLILFFEVVFLVCTPYVILFLIRDVIIINDKGIQLCRGFLFWKEEIFIAWDAIKSIRSGIALISRANIPLLIDYDNKQIAILVHIYKPRGLLKEIALRIKSDVPVELNKAHQRILRTDQVTEKE